MSQRSVVARLAEEKGLVIVSPDAMTLRRQRCGKGFSFLTKTGVKNLKLGFELDVTPVEERAANDTTSILTRWTALFPYPSAFQGASPG